MLHRQRQGQWKALLYVIRYKVMKKDFPSGSMVKYNIIKFLIITKHSMTSLPDYSHFLIIFVSGSGSTILPSGPLFQVHW